MAKPATEPRQVLTFWFSLERPGNKHDGVVREALGALYEEAATHKLDAWLRRPHDRLALILLLDQVPRHLYRLDARAYASDLKAQRATARFFERKDWNEFTSLERMYAAMPYMHAEDMEKQRLVNPVMKQIAQELPERAFMSRMVDLYQETIERFGYFPHRNEMRGLPVSPEEQEFLDTQWYPRRRSYIRGE